MPEVTINDEQFAFIRQLVHRHSSIVIGPDRKYFVEARLMALLQREQLPSCEALMAGIQEQPMTPLHRRVVDAMTTNETLFFRDIYPFELLHQQLLPGLIRARQGTRCLNLFFAGCATGQEPYSAAILLREHFPELAGWTLRLQGIDISADVIERARTGVYSQFEINRGLPAMYMVKYFQKKGLDWQIKDEIRAMVDFQQMNLVDCFPLLASVDILFMRNVLIYFDDATRKHILQSIRRQMKPDGVLFLGTAETPMYLEPGLEPVCVGKATYYRHRQDDSAPCTTEPKN